MLRQEGTEALQNNTMHMQPYVVPSGLGYPDGGNYQAQWSDNFSVGGNFVPPQGSGPSGGGGQPMRMHHQTIQVTATQGPAQPTPTSTPPGPPADMKQGSHMQPQPPQMSQGNMDMGVSPMVVQQPSRPPASAQSFASAHNYQSTRVAASQRITNQRPVLSNISHVQYPHVVPVVPVPSGSQHVIIQPVQPMPISYQGGQNRNQNQNQMPAYYTAPPHFVGQPQTYYPNPPSTQFFLRYLNQGNVTPQQQNAQQNQIGPAGYSNSGSMLQSAQAQGIGCSQDSKFRRRTNAVPIIDPETGKSIFDTPEPSSSNNTPSRSSESSARETPQPSSGHTTDDKTMAADFAARVAKVAADVSVTEISNGQPQLENISDQPSDSDILHKTHIVPSKEIKINPNALPSTVQADTDFLQQTGNDQTTLLTQEEQENREELQPPVVLTPTVSAAASVEIHHERQNKEQFPALAKSTQSSGSNQLSQSPVRTNSRKQRSSESEKQNPSVVAVSNAMSSVSLSFPVSSVDASGTNKKNQKSAQKEENYAPPKERREKSRSLSKEQSPPIVTDEITTVSVTAAILPQTNTKPATQVSSFQESVSIKNIPTVVPLISSSGQTVPQVEEKISPPPTKQQTNGETHTDTLADGKQPTQQRGKSKKNAKMRGDLNRRGVEKEGSDMDAFTESSVTVEERDRVSPVPVPSNNKMVAQTLPVQAPPPVNEQIMDTLENQEEKIVAAKNEENVKVSAVQAVKNEKSENEPPPAVIEKPVIPHMTLRHSYKEDQWSPVNPEGKKKYERDFLLELQNEPQSRKKPENLPDVEAVLKDTSNRRAQGIMSFQVSRNQDTFIPFIPKSSSQRGGVIKRVSQHKIKSSKPVIHVSLSLHEDVKLKETENAWKPSRFIQADVAEDEKETEELFKKVRGILNKLTPQKFDTLTLQLKQLPINSLPRLQGVIDLIFEKAVDEPNFSKAYANMCKILQMTEVQHNKETIKFRNLLITRCQHEFEGNKAPEIDADKRLEEIRNSSDPEKKKELQANLEEEERRVRMKSVGNIRFIGELFKLNMLTATIMHRCIEHLLSSEEEESLECLCKLLTTIGKDLEFSGTKDNPKMGVESLQPVFQKMALLAQKRDNSKISSRVRFMLQDVIELRQKHWVPRREDNNPKTIDQIQKEAERETMEMNIALSQPRNKIHDSRQDSDRKGRGSRSNNPNDENWQTVTSNKGYRSNSYFETSRLQCVKDDMNITSLGSSVQFRNFVSGGGTKGSDSKQENKSFFGQNPYQYLQKAPPSDERKTQSSMMNSNRKLTPSPSLEKERFYAHPKDSSDTGGQTSRGSSLQRERQQQLSQPTSRDSSVSRSNIVPNMQSRQPSAPPELSEEQIKRKTKNIFEEYLSLHNIQESRSCIEEAFTNVNIHRFLRSVLEMVTECKNSHIRREIGKFISELIGLNVISKQLFIDELSNMFECSEDVAIDVPLFWDYLAELIVPALSEDQITFADIRAAGSSFVKTPTAEKLLKPLFKLLVKEKDQEFVRSHMISSKVTLEDFLPASDIENCIKQNGLEYLKEGNTSGPLTMNQIQKQILEYARNNKNFDDITEWITTYVGEKINSTQFIRALITAICEASINSNKQLDKAKFKSFTNLILRFCNSVEEYELAGLSAIQALVTKLEHPSGLLMDIFNILWEDNMFSNESFLKWRDGEETEGKGVCVKSLTSFFVALSESYSEDETS